MIDIKRIVAKKKKEISDIVSLYPENSVHLSIIQVGNNAASNSYIRGKLKDCQEVGIIGDLYRFPENVMPDEVCNLIKKLSADNSCHGIIIQLPLPLQFTSEWIDEITYLIPRYKDVDGFRRDSLFTPCTPKGVLTILDNVLDKKLEGKVAIVIGRSDIVGKPMVQLLIERGCTVISCNSHTKDLDKWIKESQIVICAVGKKDFLSLQNNVDWQGKIVIDVGINKDSEGHLCGDCSSDLYNVINDITPVPGGVGLATRLSLIENTVKYLRDTQGKYFSSPFDQDSIIGEDDIVYSGILEKQIVR